MEKTCIQNVSNDPYVISLSDDTSNLGVIRQMHALLTSNQEGGREPSLGRLDDVATYEYILNSSNPKSLADLYFREKDRLRRVYHRVHITVREVAKALSWDIHGDKDAAV